MNPPQPPRPLSPPLPSPPAARPSSKRGLSYASTTGGEPPSPPNLAKRVKTYCQPQVTPQSPPLASPPAPERMLSQSRAPSPRFSSPVRSTPSRTLTSLAEEEVRGNELRGPPGDARFSLTRVLSSQPAFSSQLAPTGVQHQSWSLPAQLSQAPLAQSPAARR